MLAAGSPILLITISVVVSLLSAYFHNWRVSIIVGIICFLFSGITGVVFSVLDFGSKSSIIAAAKYGVVDNLEVTGLSAAIVLTFSLIYDAIYSITLNSIKSFIIAGAYFGLMTYFYII